MIDVLLVDDQKLFVTSLAAVLERTSSGIRVMHICCNGSDAVEYCRNHRPDIVLMDVLMPKLDGVEATRELLRIRPNLKIVMLTTFNEDRYVQRALELGAKGYLLKDMLPDELIGTIEYVMSGAMSISPAVLTNKFRRKGSHDGPEWLDELTRKEWEILKLISQGCDNSEIAGETHLAKQTVKNYVSSIYEKINVRDRMQAMRLCIKLNLFDD